MSAPVSQGANPFERWPGYDEQSWSQRFAELDRQHSAFINSVPDMLAKFTATARKQALEEAARIVLQFPLNEDMPDAGYWAVRDGEIATAIRALGSQNDG